MDTLPSSSSTSTSSSSRLPHHLQQPSSSSFADPEVFTSTHNIRPGQAFISVQTLTKESFHVAVNAKTKVHDVLWKCGERLSLSEDKLFGLAFRQPTEGIGGDQPRHEYYFLDPAAKIMKYAHKQPRFSNWHSRSTENRPILVLYFRVRVYLDQVGLLTCPKAREHYYLQLKDNFLDHWASRHCVSEERCWYMAALALITDKGTDYLGYFRAEHYFPLWVINERGLEYIRNNLQAACADILNEGSDKAMEKFMIEAGRSPFALNCHLYGLRRHKMDSCDNAVLGINARGIEMCDISEHGDRIPLRSLHWSRVQRLSFDRKKLTIIGSDGTKMSLYAQTENKAKYLLELCRAVHQTILVMSHLYATMAPPPKPYQEMSVDGISFSSTSGIGSGEHDKDSDSLSSLGGAGETTNGRCHGSVSSKLRMRVKMDSNLDVKIEKMELEHIRQERAASQSSKASDESSSSRLDTKYMAYHPIALSCATSSTHTVTTQETTRPSSIDNASQTVESGISRSNVDVNFNTKPQQRGSLLALQHNQEQQQQHSDDDDTIERVQSSSAHDLRATTHSPLASQWKIPTTTSFNHQTRSETQIDNSADVWQRAGRFVKKNSAGSRGAAAAINRVHSMPSHYHVNGVVKTTGVGIDETIYTPSLPQLTHAHSMNSRPRNPPPYEPMMMMPSNNIGGGSSPPPLSLGPLPAEAAGGQPSFPPASATPNQYNLDDRDIQNYPMMLQLLKDHQQQTQIPKFYVTTSQQQQQQHGKTHQRRPSSSCIDLTSDGMSYIPPPIVVHRGEYLTDSAFVQQNSLITSSSSPFVTSAVKQPLNNSSTTLSFISNTNSTQQQQQQHNGNIHLPPPPPYQSQSQQMVN